MNKKLVEKIEIILAMPIEELCIKYNCKPEEICMGDYIARNTDDTVCPYKVILGFANFENSNVTDLGPLEVVFGKKLKDRDTFITDLNSCYMYHGINLRGSKVSSLGNLIKVYGSFSLNSRIKSFGKLSFLGSGLYFNRTTIKTIDTELQVDGMVNVENCELVSLGGLKATRSLNIDSKSLQSFGDLEKVSKISFGVDCDKKMIGYFEKTYARSEGKFIRKDLINNQSV